eukprot:Rmarinus@m.9121
MISSVLRPFSTAVMPQVGKSENVKVEKQSSKIPEVRGQPVSPSRLATKKTPQTPRNFRNTFLSFLLGGLAMGYGYYTLHQDVWNSRRRVLSDLGISSTDQAEDWDTSVVFPSEVLDSSISHWNRGVDELHKNLQQFIAYVGGK